MALPSSLDIRDIEFKIINDNYAKDDPSFELEAVSEDKKKWKSLKINLEAAKELTNGVYSYHQLKTIVQLILVNSQFKNEPDLSAQLTQVQQDILVTINIQEKFGSREISIPLDSQVADDIWVLRQLIEDKDKQIQILNKKLEETNDRVETLNKALSSCKPIVVRLKEAVQQSWGSNQRVDVCKVVLPAGEWLVHYRCTRSPAKIPFKICYGETTLVINPNGASEQTTGSFFTVTANGEDSLWVQLFDAYENGSGRVFPATVSPFTSTKIMNTTKVYTVQDCLLWCSPSPY